MSFFLGVFGLLYFLNQLRKLSILSLTSLQFPLQLSHPHIAFKDLLVQVFDL